MLERLWGFSLAGSTVVLCLLFGLLIWVIAKAIERWTFFGARRDDLDRVGDDLVSHLRHGDFAGADRVLTQSPSIEAALVRPALDWVDGGPDAVEAVLDAKRIGNRRDLQRSLLAIAIIGRDAPWIGMVGTFISLIGTFRLLEQEQGKDMMSTLWHGVSMALIPAGAGVVVGVATAITHSFLAEKVRHIEENAAILSKQLLAILRFKKKLAAEFGLDANGFGHDSGALNELDADEDADRGRTLSQAELD